MDYTYVLMDIILECGDTVPGGVPDMDNLLNRRIAEGKHSSSLKREMHGKNEERSSLKFLEFTEHA